MISCFSLTLTRSRPSQAAGLCGIRRVLALSSEFSSSSVSSSSKSTARNLALSPTAAISSTLRLSHQSLTSASLRAQRKSLAQTYSFAALRFASTGKPRPNLIPERLLIYHAGTGRATFLACLKVTTVFGLAFFTFLVAPAYIIADKPLWQVLGIITCGIVPFVVASYTSSPFVVFIHLRLPAYARHPDRELLRRFVRNPPAGTQLDFTTMNLVGRPRLATVAVSDLVPAHERLGIVNLIDTQASAQQAVTASNPNEPGAKLRNSSAPTMTKQRSSASISFSSRFPFVHLPPNTRFGAPAVNNSRGVQYAWAWDDLLALIQGCVKQPKERDSKSE